MASGHHERTSDGRVGRTVISHRKRRITISNRSHLVSFTSSRLRVGFPFCYHLTVTASCLWSPDRTRTRPPAIQEPIHRFGREQTQTRPRVWLPQSSSMTGATPPLMPRLGVVRFRRRLLDLAFEERQLAFS
ncbi:hypothetical protein ColTof4_14324 [Colletotrichum tofieldiae]|nr:hypothetical protein ColTof4_14324 [Colletotrichum tofieldiae]